MRASNFNFKAVFGLLFCFVMQFGFFNAVPHARAHAQMNSPNMAPHSSCARHESKSHHLTTRNAAHHQESCCHAPGIVALAGPTETMPSRRRPIIKSPAAPRYDREFAGTESVPLLPPPRHNRA
ncbi:hypothetical protein [Kozakia baliensis]|uniref:hypothetical protein n=1 Tax=Kozakia baliensis TaxID=153496 RepID=UPI00087DF32E|nr:hypothetical protein [Kozakia baliensis]AOX18989.1 hypothetical protein A0U90_00225 [Kozakia baliensis]